MRRRTIAIVTTLALGAIVALAGRSRLGTDVVETIAATDAVDARRVRFARGDAAFVATFVRFDRNRAAARLVDVGEGQTLADVAGDATLAINGGYFDAAFAPLGLYRIDRRQAVPMLTRPPLSGVVTIDSAGRLDFAMRDDPTAPSAFQAGPFVIDPGGATGIRHDDGKLAERTVIATDDHSLCVIVTTPATLRAVADALHDRPDAFGLSRVDRALNLDGGPSAGFVLNVDGRRVASPPRGRIRSAVTFTAP